MFSESGTAGPILFSPPVRLQPYARSEHFCGVIDAALSFHRRSPDLPTLRDLLAEGFAYFDREPRFRHHRISLTSQALYMLEVLDITRLVPIFDTTGLHKLNP